MKGFAVLDGGGVRGAALAGCLSAADDQGIQFQGYGGTSAGALVALLASVGYGGKEIRNMLVDEIRPRAMLNDEGKRFDQLQSCHRQLIEVVASEDNLLRKLMRVRRIYREGREIVETLWTESGVYGGELLQDILRKKILKKLPSLKAKEPLGFRELEAAGGKPLKIVAADLSSKAAAIFSSADGFYGESHWCPVISRIASVGYGASLRPSSRAWP